MVLCNRGELVTEVTVLLISGLLRLSKHTPREECEKLLSAVWKKGCYDLERSLDCVCCFLIFVFSF